MPKTILITGTSSGFGELTAYQLADEGHIVYASMRDITTSNADKAEEAKHCSAEHGVTSGRPSSMFKIRARSTPPSRG